jgi:hypothetical protein
MPARWNEREGQAELGRKFGAAKRELGNEKKSFLAVPSSWMSRVEKNDFCPKGTEVIVSRPQGGAVEGELHGRLPGNFGPAKLNYQELMENV